VKTGLYIRNGVNMRTQVQRTVVFLSRGKFQKKSEYRKPVSRCTDVASPLNSHNTNSNTNRATLQKVVF